VDQKDFSKIIFGDQLTESPQKLHGTKELEQLLLQEDLELAFIIDSITQITEADKIAQALVIVFQDNNSVFALLQAFISDEVRHEKDNPHNLFRSNSMASKMFRFYAKLIGSKYLYSTIGPEICELVDTQMGTEVDPEKMDEGLDVDENRWTLMAQSQKVLRQILGSLDACPTQFRLLMAHVKESVRERWPDAVNSAIAGFFFLRFFCPAISSPEVAGIVEEPPSVSSRRLLVLITKVLQNVSTLVEFGTKEPYMAGLNDFIVSNKPKMISFYDKMVKPTSKPVEPCTIPKNVKVISLEILAQHILDNIERIDNPKWKSDLKDILHES